jgi:hypothetical protein
MKRVVLESPYAAPTPSGIDLNVRYARACVRDCLKRGEAPIASHLLFTQPGILRDEVPEERALGMAAGFAWGELAEACVVYEDRGVSRGMLAGIARAEARGVPVERRKLGDWWAPEGGLERSLADESFRRELADEFARNGL